MAEAMNLEGRIRRNLVDAACPEDLIQAFLSSLTQGKEKDGLRLLQKHKKTLLDIIHANQKHIDCLDYLIYKLDKGDCW